MKLANYKTMGLNMNKSALLMLLMMAGVGAGVRAQTLLPGTPPADLDAFLRSDNFRQERDSIQTRRIKTLSKYLYRGNASTHVDADSMEWQERFTFNERGECVLVNGRGEATRKYEYNSAGVEKRITVVRRNRAEGEDIWTRRFDDAGRLTEAIVKNASKKSGLAKGKQEMWRVEQDKIGRVKAEFYKGLKVKEFEYAVNGRIRTIRHFKADKQTPPSAELLTIEDFDSCGMIAAVTVVNVDTTRAGALQLDRTPVEWRQKPDSCPCARRRPYGFIVSTDTILMPGKRKVVSEELRSNGHKIQTVEIASRTGKILELETKEWDERDSLKIASWQLFNGRGKVIERKTVGSKTSAAFKHEKVYYFPMGLPERVDFLDENGVVLESEIFVLRYFPKKK
jgi:hypothetical protein